MINKFLKAAGVKTKEEFYKKYPNEAAFFKAHPEMKKLRQGGQQKKLNQLTSYSGDIDGIMPKAQTGWQDMMWGQTPSISGQMPSAPANPAAAQTYGMDVTQTGSSQAMGLNNSPLGSIATPGGSPTKKSFLDKLGGAAGLLSLGETIVGGIGDIKAQKQAYKRAKQTNRLVGLTEQAVLSGLNQPDPRRQYVTHERNPFTIEEMGLPFQGNPVNYLAQDGAVINQIGGNPTEIQNMYNPGTLYGDLGYEPLSESDDIKQYRYGGMPRAAGGFDVSSIIPGVTRLSETAFNKMGLNNSATGNLAGNVLGTVGGAFLGPLGGVAGQFVGKALGKVIDPTADKMAKLNKDSERRTLNLGMMSGMRDASARFSSFMQDGGYIATPRQQDYMDYETYSQAMDDYLASLPTQTAAPSQAAAQQAAPTTTKTQLKDYQGVSVVDFLKTQGKASDYASRKKLAKELGIENYTGSASQNKEIMNRVKENPDVLSGYADASTSTGSGRKKSSSPKTAYTDPTTGKKYTQAELDAIDAGLMADAERAMAQQADSDAYWEDYRLRTTPIVAAPNQAYFSQGTTPVGPGSGKVDPTMRWMEQDPNTIANINTRKRKDFATELAVGTLAPYLAEGALMAATTRYLPYGLRAIPEVTATARRASRAIPYATRAIGYEDGGYVSHNWNPQVIAKWGDVDVSDVHNIFTEGMPKYRTGGNLQTNYMSYDEEQLMSMDLGGQLEIMDGGYAKPIGKNPYLPNTGTVMMLNGRSHDDGGMPLRYGENMVEAEGGEPIMELADEGTILPDGTPDVSAVIAGNLPISGDAAGYAGRPDLKNMKYKNAVRDIAKNDKSISNKRDKNMTRLSDLDVRTPFDKLKLNSLSLNEKGYDMQHLSNANAINKLMEYQNNINDTAEKMSEMMGRKVSADALAKGKLNFERGDSGDIAQAGTKIKRSALNKFLAENPGYKQDPKNPNRYVRKGSKDVVIKGETTTTKTVSKTAPKAVPGGEAGEPWKNKMRDLLNSGVSYEELAAKGHGTVEGLKKMFPGEYKEVEKTVITPDRTESTPFEEDILVEDEAKKTTTDTTTKKKFDYGLLASGLSGMFRPSDALGYLKGPQIYGELAALSMNQLEPVYAQGLQPLLKQPFRVSLDRQRGDIRSTFANAKRLTQGDPAAQSLIASAEAQNLQQIGDKEFMLNQEEFARTYAENRDLLNRYDLINQQIFDTQQDRQAAARSVTKATAQEAIASMADKQLKRELEDAYLRVGENMYNYRFGPDYRVQNYNPFAYFQMPTAGQAAMPPVNKNAATTSETTTEAPTETARKGKSVSKKNKYNSNLAKALKNI